MGTASRELKRNGLSEEASEMINSITKNAKSYDDALAIMCEYIDPVDKYDMNEYDDFEIDI